MTAQKNEQSERVVATPLASIYETLNAEPVERQGIEEYPVFTSVEEELDAIKKGAAFIDRAQSSFLELEGADVLTFLDRIATRDLKNLHIDHCLDTLFLSQKGAMIDFAQIGNLEETVFIIGKEEESGKLESWINKYVHGKELQVKNVRGIYTAADFFGEQSYSFLILLFGQQNVSNLELNRIVRISFESKFVQVIAKQTPNGINYFRIIAPVDEMKAITAYSLEHKGVFQFSLTGARAERLFRIRTGLPSANEINYRYSPLEANMQKFIDTKKGGFLGKDALMKYAARRSNLFVLVKLEVEGIEALPEKLLIVDKNHNEIGEITTLENEPGSKSSEALAYLKTEFAKQGDSLKVKDENDKIYKAVVVKSDFR